MIKKINTRDQHHVDSSPDLNKGGSSRQPNQQSAEKSAQTAASNLVPQTQQESRSDQEQEGRQNPAGDTRDVSREPVDTTEPLTKK